MLTARIKRKRIGLYVVKNQYLAIKGPLGNVTFRCDYEISNRKLFFPSKALANIFFNKTRSLIKGLLYGFFIELRTEGVGLKFMRFSTAPQLLSLSFGFSHTILYKMPAGIRFRCLKYRLLLFSNQITTLTKIAFRIKGYRPSDPYKGKGVKFITEVLKIKPGKQRQR